MSIHVDPAKAEEGATLVTPIWAQAALKMQKDLASLEQRMTAMFGASGKDLVPACRRLVATLIDFFDCYDGSDDHEPDDFAEDDDPAGGDINDEPHDDDADKELSLGWLDDTDQSRLSMGCGGRDEDQEQSLGSLDGRFSQKRWGEADRPGWFTGNDHEVCPRAAAPKRTSTAAPNVKIMSAGPYAPTQVILPDGQVIE